jgi:nitroreductase
MTPSDLLDALNFRYATKAFDPAKHIPAETWDALLDSLVLTPSSFGLQPWRFLVVEDPAVRAQLREVSWNQGQVTDADKLVVFTTRTDLTPDDTARWIQRLAEVQGQHPDDLVGFGRVIDGFANNMTVGQRHSWNTRQTYIALGQFMTAAAVLGIDTCPLEGMDPASYDRILGLEGGDYATSVACAVGYRADSDHHAARPKARFAKDEVIRTV